MLSLYDEIINHEWFENRFAEYYRWYPKSLSVPMSSVTIGASKVRGIYVHVPFCDELCKFCPFNKKRNEVSLLIEYVRSIVQEIQLYSRQGVEGTLEFVYFGGGTPSVLSNEQFRTILTTIHEYYDVASDCEVSIEAHPTHINDDAVLGWKSSGINRVSSGIQTLSSTNLERLGATHAIDDSFKAVDTLSRLVEKSAIDLLYRCEGQSVSDWQSDLNYLDQYSNISHVSCYTLFLPNDSKQPDALTDVQMAIAADDYFKSRGFRHYASCATGGFDFANRDNECKYEAMHWSAPQTAYLALGPGALGYVNNCLTVNAHSLPTYFKTIQEDKLPLLSQTYVDEAERRHRFFSLGVKTLHINLNDYTALFGQDATEDFNTEFSALKKLGLISIDNNFLKLTDIGRFYVDQISAVFWSEAQRNVPHPETTTMMSMERKMSSYKAS